MKKLKKKLKINRIILISCIVLLIVEITTTMQYKNKILSTITAILIIIEIIAIIITRINIQKLVTKINDIDTIQTALKKD